MPTLRDAQLVEASVPEGGSFGDAARALTESRASALAVLGADRRVVGFFTANALIAGLVPRYLRELRHTAFADDDLEALARRGREAASEPVTRHLSRAVVLELDTSATHAAERFLHTNAAAIAVVEQERFVGLLARSELARLLVERSGLL
jgi:CBS domain-containing protein